ncbi:MAG TPA: disulfide bond formation protein B [Ancylobacter sp.]
MSITDTRTRRAFISPKRSHILNALGLIAVCAVLGFAFLDQFVNGDLPCPLCILQRAGFVGVGLGLALNLKFGARPSHYGIAILSAMVGGFISARQVLLHIVPGTGTYGDPFLGLHFYSWAFALSVVITAGCAVLLLFDRQFEPLPPDVAPRRLGTLGLVGFVLFGALSLGNGASTVLECGQGLCPDNPTGYLLLEGEPPASTTP